MDYVNIILKKVGGFFCSEIMEEKIMAGFVMKNNNNMGGNELNLTQEQKEQLGIIDERVDFYFKVENAVIDGYTVETINEKTGKIEVKEKSYFDNVYELAVYTALSRYCNNDVVIFPSQETLAIHCCCGKTSVKNAIKSLEEKGFIKKINRKKNGSNDTNLYVVKKINNMSGCK